jgi:hypothetical protein
MDIVAELVGLMEVFAAMDTATDSFSFRESLHRRLMPFNASFMAEVFERLERELNAFYVAQYGWRSERRDRRTIGTLTGRCALL